jgi:hypothetical protein
MVITKDNLIARLAKDIEESDEYILAFKKQLRKQERQINIALAISVLSTIIVLLMI